MVDVTTVHVGCDNNKAGEGGRWGANHGAVRNDSRSLRARDRDSLLRSEDHCRPVVGQPPVTDHTGCDRPSTGRRSLPPA